MILLKLKDSDNAAYRCLCLDQALSNPRVNEEVFALLRYLLCVLIRIYAFL